MKLYAVSGWALLLASLIESCVSGDIRPNPQPPADDEQSSDVQHTPSGGDDGFMVPPQDIDPNYPFGEELPDDYQP